MSAWSRISYTAAYLTLVGCQAPGLPSAEPSEAAASPSVASASATETTGGLLTLTGDPASMVPPGVYQSSVPQMRFTVPEASGDEQWYGSQGSTGWAIRLGSDPC